MNRRDFIKTTGAAVAASSLPSPAEEPQGVLTGTTINPHRMWSYRVYCYERGQGEWTFSKDTTGSFSYLREYEIGEETHSVYSGWMDHGKLHFCSLEEAQDFINTHVKSKDNAGVIDRIYDIYHVDWDNLEYESCQPLEIQVAHYWFNGDTGRQIEWVANKPYTNWNKVELG